MYSGSSGYEGVVDVGLIVLAHCENPAWSYARDFLREVLGLKRRCVVPLSTYIGAHVIMTKYLKLPRAAVTEALVTTLSLDSPAFFGDISRTTAIGALETAGELKISSWDGYLLELARRMNLTRVYTIDEELKRRVRHLEVINPIPAEVMQEYHEYVASRITR
jgi:predicted nucleic acid-binding protein